MYKLKEEHPSRTPAHHKGVALGHKTMNKPSSGTAESIQK